VTTVRPWVSLLALATVFAAGTHAYAEDLPAGAASASPRLVQTIPLPGVEGRIDHLALDTAGERLFVAALGNDTLEMVDLKKGERARSLPGFKEPQGVRYIADTNTVVVASGGDGSVTFLDGTSLRVKGSVRIGTDADNVRYDAAHKRLLVGYGDGAIGLLDTRGTQLGDVTLDAHPESFQLDSRGHAFVNVASKQKVAVIDLDKKAVTTTWPLAGAANFAMALDDTHDRLFVATRRPPSLVVLDTAKGTLVATLDADKDADDLFYDETTQRLYAICGGGSVIVYDQTDADHYKILATVPTAEGARTGLFSPELHRLYVAIPHRSGTLAEIRVYVTP
jgi:DNA-binding beta-propeller fold protein YncE